MAAIELFHKDGRQSGIYYCDKCRIVSKEKSLAEACCCPTKCEDCDNDTGTRFVSKCKDCRVRDQAKRKAEILANAELVEDYEGWIFSDDVPGGQDGYFDSIESILDHIDDAKLEDEDYEPPEFAYCCKAEVLEADIDRLTMCLHEDGWEDMLDYATGMDELKEAVDAFNRQNATTFTVYNVDYKRKVRLNG